MLADSLTHATGLTVFLRWELPAARFAKGDHWGLFGGGAAACYRSDGHGEKSGFTGINRRRGRGSLAPRILGLSGDQLQEVDFAAAREGFSVDPLRCTRFRWSSLIISASPASAISWPETYRPGEIHFSHWAHSELRSSHDCSVVAKESIMIELA